MEIKEQQISLFIVPGIPEDFHFETKTRKEISVSGHPSQSVPD
jgi:mRNA-decapping enzyme subunit 2